ncbi:TM0106 family RecB-like putative nuclease [Crocosphaera sp.]|uniref:TM0106 family RecB-like putative nuclease n=1 Tax=Crocosphaera sp. TaxID=2729996 RepID=UPI003F235740|nr:TM0106 family RecB-like putative nuclease [Crocosphaera sp.]
MLITDSLLLDYKRCSRRAFLNLHGDPTQQDQERDFLDRLRQENKRHIASVLDTYYPHYERLPFSQSSWQEKAQATEVLMQQGVDCIYKGILWVDDQCSNSIEWRENSPRILPFGYDYLGKPHLLIKQPGQSKFGDWFYYPISIHLGRKAKPEYKLVATFYAQLLAIIQESTPPIAELIIRPLKHSSVDIVQWLPKLQLILEECVTILETADEPDVFIARQRCNLCRWYSYCHAIAQSQQHLSLVPGVTPSRYQSLQEIGILTTDSLAKANLDSIKELMGTELAEKLQQQAHSLVHNHPLARPQSQYNLPEILSPRRIELYFDIEAEPERNVDYLLGVVVVDRLTQTQIFYPFLAETPEEEGVIWQQFLELVNTYDHAPIFHFSDYEKDTIKRLGKLYKTPDPQIQHLLSRLIDLHHCVITSVILPVENYSLKSLANWLGFHWRDAGISGDQCVCWYDQWLTTGDRSCLSSILRYNEDDCLATLHLKNWLLEFFSKIEFSS